MNKETMTESEFNSIPTFFHNGKECIEVDGRIYTKSGLFKMLYYIGMIKN